MKHIKLEAGGEPVDEQALIDLEKYVGAAICTQYKNFLRMQNGGSCRPEVRSKLPALAYPLALFLRLRRDGSSLKHTFDYVNEFRESPQILPIAMTIGQEFICIELGVETPKLILFSPDKSESICADSWLSFVNSLVQQSEEARPFLEVIAKQPWDYVREYIESGGELVPSEGLSLLSQSIRVNNLELFRKLMDVKSAWGDLDRAMEVAVINKRLEFVKLLVDMGGNRALAASRAVGPEREAIRAYLKSVLP
ncbi:hypothetical protein DTL42_19190 [Bremerella cremea]|uniref:Knr4/Smi1-like domain-containing protein n=1 Tax=Bremerella cremea TaxID=1031537 RepID=A0A368KMF7_9BACT|nr:SMI1/KNR4 family protein [Bremerella cremea]RCS43280.1 hypothetical protein DTL42_19190 [Bremerella cremea]